MSCAATMWLLTRSYSSWLPVRSSTARFRCRIAPSYSMTISLIWFAVLIWVSRYAWTGSVELTVSAS